LRVGVSVAVVVAEWQAAQLLWASTGGAWAAVAIPWWHAAQSTAAAACRAWHEVQLVAPAVGARVVGVVWHSTHCTEPWRGCGKATVRARGGVVAALMVRARVSGELSSAGEWQAEQMFRSGFWWWQIWQPRPGSKVSFDRERGS
jgi:hypothetical protein